MRKWMGCLVTVLAVLGVLAAAPQAGARKAKDGKAIFLENKCQSCHAIESQGLARKKLEGDEEKGAEGSKKPPDLSNVGSAHDAAWMARFLMKLESKDREKHRRKFKGGEADLKTLTAWLATLKPEKRDK